MQEDKDKNQTTIKKLETLFGSLSLVSSAIEKNNKEVVVHINKIDNYLNAIKKLKK